MMWTCVFNVDFINAFISHLDARFINIFIKHTCNRQTIPSSCRLNQVHYGLHINQRFALPVF